MEWTDMLLQGYEWTDILLNGPELSDILLDASMILGIAAFATKYQIDAFKGYVKQYAIAEKSGIPEEQLDMGAVEDIVSDYSGMYLRHGGVFKDNKEKLLGNYKRLEKPDKLI